MKHLFYIFLSLIFIPNLIFSQNDKNARIIIDTVNSKGFDIILFENNTWEYINQDSVLAVIKFNDSIKLYNDIYENRLLELDSLTVFSENWDTINIFAFDIFSPACNHSLAELGINTRISPIPFIDGKAVPAQNAFQFKP